MFDLKVLCKEETEQLLEMPEVIQAVESAYAQKAAKRAEIFDWVFYEFEHGVADMDIKSGWLQDEGVFGLKSVSWYRDNPGKGHPCVIGVIMVYDDETGRPIGLVDGSHITGMRTGASGAIGAKYLAKEGADTLLMVGTGHIAKFEIAATLIAVPSITKVLIHDPMNHEGALKLAEKMPAVLTEAFGVSHEMTITASEDLEAAVRKSDVIITATPSRKPMIMKDWVQPGTHFSCVGSDMPGKEEIDPYIFEDARVFVDDLKQCMNIGEIEIPIKKGTLTAEAVAGEIGEIIIDQVTGRENNQQITIYDATGTALLDLVTAQLAFSKAKEQNIGTSVNL